MSLKIKQEQISSMIPKVFALETTLGCDLCCPECAVGGGLITRQKGFISFDQFKIIADKIRPFAKMFFLHLWGEPMLNKDIIPMIRYASDFTRTNISTNCMSMDETKAEELVLSGVSEIIVSIDGMSQNIYQRYRVGGDLAKAKSMLVFLQKLNEQNGNIVKIIPQYVVFKHNQHEMEEFKKFCNNIGLIVSFKAPYIRDNSRFENSDFPEYKRQHFPDKEQLFKAMQGCVNPREVFTILIDGSVVLCCHDYNRVTYFGNIFEQDVMEIWNSSEYHSYRLDITNGNIPEFCIEYCQTYYLDK